MSFKNVFVALGAVASLAACKTRQFGDESLTKAKIDSEIRYVAHKKNGKTSLTEKRTGKTVSCENVGRFEMMCVIGESHFYVTEFTPGDFALTEPFDGRKYTCQKQGDETSRNCRELSPTTRIQIARVADKYSLSGKIASQTVAGDCHISGSTKDTLICDGKQHYVRVFLDGSKNVSVDNMAGTAALGNANHTLDCYVGRVRDDNAHLTTCWENVMMSGL